MAWEQQQQKQNKTKKKNFLMKENELEKKEKPTTLDPRWKEGKGQKEGFGNRDRDKKRRNI